MSGYKSFAIWGAGTLGSLIVGELLKQKVAGTIDRVVVFTRPESKESDANKAFEEKGVEVISFDINSSDSASLLSGIDVLISTVAIPIIHQQLKVITPAKQAGVKLYVPCEWGDNSDGRTERIFQLKQKVKADCEEAGLPYVAFYHGPWPEQMNLFGFDSANNKFRINGEGEAPISFTSHTDVARYVAHALTQFPKEKLENARFAIEGDRISFKQIAAEYEKATGNKLEITHVPRAYFEQAASKEGGEMAGLLLGWDTGKGVVSSTPEDTANSLYPDWNPKKVIDVILGK